MPFSTGYFSPTRFFHIENHNIFSFFHHRNHFRHQFAFSMLYLNKPEHSSTSEYTHSVPKEQFLLNIPDSKPERKHIQHTILTVHPRHHCTDQLKALFYTSILSTDSSNLYTTILSTDSSNLFTFRTTTPLCTIAHSSFTHPCDYHHLSLP